MIVSVHHTIPITIVAHTRAPKPRATPATKFGHSIFHGDLIYSINSSSHVASMASMSHSTFSCSSFGSFFIMAALLFGIFFISCSSFIDFSMIELFTDNE